MGIILTCAPGGDRFDPDRPTSYSTVMSALPELPRKWVRHHHKHLRELMVLHPAHFRVIDEENF